jgi:hypothetical protein
MAFPSFLRWLFASPAGDEAAAPTRRLVLGQTDKGQKHVKCYCAFETFVLL